MLDPYSVLGLSRTAPEDEVKKAYRALSRKYHPDANVNNPNRDKAEEKFKEIQQAYQQIMREREMGSGYDGGGYSGNYGNGFAGGFGGFGQGGFGGFGSSQGASEDEYTIHMRAAANFIRSGHYNEAMNVLNGISNKTAGWYYLSAIANAGIGNNVLALQYAKQAAAMEPNNRDYRNLVYQMESGGTWYQGRQNPYGSAVYMGNDCCMKLCLANLLCNLCCCGGGRL